MKTESLSFLSVAEVLTSIAVCAKDTGDIAMHQSEDSAFGL